MTDEDWGRLLHEQQEKFDKLQAKRRRILAVQMAGVAAILFCQYATSGVIRYPWNLLWIALIAAWGLFFMILHFNTHKGV